MLKRQFQAQSTHLCQLKEQVCVYTNPCVPMYPCTSIFEICVPNGFAQVWVAEQEKQRSECEAEQLQLRLAEYSQQICQLKSQLESLQTQFKEAQARMEINEEQVSVLELRASGITKHLVSLFFLLFYHRRSYDN